MKTWPVVGVVAVAVAMVLGAAWLAWKREFVWLLATSPVALLVLGLLVQAAGIRSREGDP